MIRFSPMRVALVVLPALALLWVSLAVTMVGVLGTRRPQLVLTWWPWSARAKATSAASMIAGNRGAAQLRQTVNLAQGALRRELLRPEAYRTLALVRVHQGDERGSLGLLQASEGVSRRDVETELLLIEANVAQGNVAGALIHYDRILTVKPEMASVLFPILATASADAAVRPVLASILGRRPTWGMAYLIFLLDQGKNAPAILTAATALRPDPRRQEERERLRDALVKLVEARQYGSAYALYRRALPQETGLLRNGSFQRDNLLQPFDWQVSDDADLGGVIESIPGTGSALIIIATNGRGGQIARQLLMLPPGPARLAATAGNTASAAIDRPRLVLTCASDGRAIGALPMSVAGDRGATASTTVTVPPACVAQWLAITASSPEEGDAHQPWITRISVVPVRK